MALKTLPPRRYNRYTHTLVVLGVDVSGKTYTRVGDNSWLGNRILFLFFLSIFKRLTRLERLQFLIDVVRTDVLVNILRIW